MRSKTFLTAALLALALVPAAQAQYRDRDRSYDRYDAGRADLIARDIEQTAVSIQRQFVANNRRPNRAEARAAAGLYDLARAADRLNDELDGYRRDRRRSRDEFERIGRAFDRAADALADISPRPYVDRGMARIEARLAELSRYYGYDQRSRWGDGRYRYDRYDERNRYDDRYDDRYDGDGRRP